MVPLAPALLILVLLLLMAPASGWISIRLNQPAGMGEPESKKNSARSRWLNLAFTGDPPPSKEVQDA